MRDLEDSPVVAIFLDLSGGHEEGEGGERGEIRINGGTSFHTPKFGKTCGGKVIPRIDSKVAGLSEITSAFPF